MAKRRDHRPAVDITGVDTKHGHTTFIIYHCSSFEDVMRDFKKAYAETLETLDDVSYLMEDEDV